MTQVTWSTLVDCLWAESPSTCGLWAFWPEDNLLVWSGHLDHPLMRFSYFIYPNVELANQVWILVLAKMANGSEGPEITSLSFDMVGNVVECNCK
jgi:hypothetical protein